MVVSEGDGRVCIEDDAGQRHWEISRGEVSLE
jgi:hypothetical protein